MKLNRFSEEIKEYLINKYIFIETRQFEYPQEGWCNIMPGINLISDEYSDGHYHVHFYGKSENVNLFQLIGTKFKCSCFYFNKKGKVKECNEYFIFTNKVNFSRCTFYINGKREEFGDKAYYYKLEKEKIRLINNKKNKGFYIDRILKIKIIFIIIKL